MRRLTKKEGGTTTQIGITHYGDPIMSLLVLSDGRWISDDWKKISSADPELIQTFDRWADVSAKDGATMASPGVDLGVTSTEQAFLIGRGRCTSSPAGQRSPPRSSATPGSIGASRRAPR